MLRLIPVIPETAQHVLGFTSSRKGMKYLIDSLQVMSEKKCSFSVTDIDVQFCKSFIKSVTTKMKCMEDKIVHSMACSSWVISTWQI